MEYRHTRVMGGKGSGPEWFEPHPPRVVNGTRRPAVRGRRLAGDGVRPGGETGVAMGHDQAMLLYLCRP